MSRYAQTIARLGAGYSVLGSLVWLLWPSSLSFVDNPEAWFVFGTAFVVWHLAEFRYSEEIRHREERRAFEPTEYDRVVARKIIDFHQGEVFYTLKNVNLWTLVETQVYKQIWKLIEDRKSGKLFFSHKKMEAELEQFIASLGELSKKVAIETTEETVAGKSVIGYKPLRIVSQEEYDERMRQSEKADQLAGIAAEKLEDLIDLVRELVPSAYSINDDAKE